MEDIISAPCLLDDLMDNGLINVDISFGDLDKENGVVNSKKSPSHESDSGVSIMSSPQHSITSDFDHDENMSLSPPCFENFGNLFDNELTDYLNDNNEDLEVENLMSKPMKLDQGQSDCKTYHNNLQRQISSDSTSSNHSVGVVTRAATVHRKPALVSNLDVNENKQNINQAVGSKVAMPSVKVIKVVSAPKSTPRLQMEKEIFEAIEEKNKKNAHQAKINREKKKAYIKSLEDEVEILKSENSEISSKMEKLNNHKNALEEEVEYLKSVLANQSTLSNLLKNIPNANVKLSSSFMQRKRSAAHDHDYENPSKRAKKSKTAGVCLHVENENVSLEFCASCSKNAQQGCSCHDNQWDQHVGVLPALDLICYAPWRFLYKKI